MTIQTPHTVEPFPIREGRDKAAVLAVARLIEVAPGRDMRITLTRTYAADPDAHTTTILAAVADRALAAEMAAVLGLTGVLFDLGVAWVGSPRTTAFFSSALVSATRSSRSDQTPAGREPQPHSRAPA